MVISLGVLGVLSAFVMSGFRSYFHQEDTLQYKGLN